MYNIKDLKKKFIELMSKGYMDDKSKTVEDILKIVANIKDFADYNPDIMDDEDDEYLKDENLKKYLKEYLKDYQEKVMFDLIDIADRYKYSSEEVEKLVMVFKEKGANLGISSTSREVTVEKIELPDMYHKDCGTVDYNIKPYSVEKKVNNLLEYCIYKGSDTIITALTKIDEGNIKHLVEELRKKGVDLIQESTVPRNFIGYFSESAYNSISAKVLELLLKFHDTSHDLLSVRYVTNVISDDVIDMDKVKLLLKRTNPNEELNHEELNSYEKYKSCKVLLHVILKKLNNLMHLGTDDPSVHDVREGIIYDYIEILKLLFEIENNPADVTIEDYEGQSPLDMMLNNYFNSNGVSSYDGEVIWYDVITLVGKVLVGTDKFNELIRKIRNIHQESKGVDAKKLIEKLNIVALKCAIEQRNFDKAISILESDDIMDLGNHKTTIRKGRSMNDRDKIMVDSIIAFHGIGQRKIERLVKALKSKGANLGVADIMMLDVLTGYEKGKGKYHGLLVVSPLEVCLYKGYNDFAVSLIKHIPDFKEFIKAFKDRVKCPRNNHLIIDRDADFIKIATQPRWCSESKRVFYKAYNLVDGYKIDSKVIERFSFFPNANLINVEVLDLILKHSNLPLSIRYLENVINCCANYCKPKSLFDNFQNCRRNKDKMKLLLNKGIDCNKGLDCTEPKYRFCRVLLHKILCDIEQPTVYSFPGLEDENAPYYVEDTLTTLKQWRISKEREHSIEKLDLLISHNADPTIEDCNCNGQNSFIIAVNHYFNDHNSDSERSVWLEVMKTLLKSPLIKPEHVKEVIAEAKKLQSEKNVNAEKLMSLLEETKDHLPDSTLENASTSNIPQGKPEVQRRKIEK